MKNTQQFLLILFVALLFGAIVLIAFDMQRLENETAVLNVQNAARAEIDILRQQVNALQHEQENDVLYGYILGRIDNAESTNALECLQHESAYVCAVEYADKFNDFGVWLELALKDHNTQAILEFLLYDIVG